MVSFLYFNFLSLRVIKLRKHLLKRLESSEARVELLERAEELLVIKRSEDDLEPLQLTVNKRVSPIK